MGRLSKNKRSYNMNTVDGTGYEEDELLSRLSPEEREFYQEFNEESYRDSPKTEWGKKRRAAQVADMYNNNKRLLYRHPTHPTYAYRSNFDDTINRRIDLERGVCASNDLEPGIIRTSFGYRCSVKTPDGYEKRQFLTLDAAKQWRRFMQDKYKDVCYDVY
jgi:hypothetical protein